MRITPLLFLSAASFLPLVPVAADPGDVAPAQPVIPARVFHLQDFGAVADGRTPDTGAFRRAIAAVDAAGGGTLVVPAGAYFTGPLDLCSNLNLHLAAGARLLFSQKFDDYRLEGNKYHPLVQAKDCHDVLISGAGVFDGKGQPWWVIERKAKDAARARGLPDAEIGRPRLIILDHCQRVRLEGVTLTNSPMFHLVPLGCADVTIDGIKILAPADSPNTDGIDPSVSRTVLITHCRIDTGDDCIAVKAGPKGFGPAQDILVTDCTFLHGHGCSVGSDTNAGVRRMTVRRCTFNGTDAGVRLKSGRGRGGLVEDITYTDLAMENVGEPIVITSYYYGLPKPGIHDEARPVAADTPRWRHITISHVTATDGRKDAGLIIGLPEMPAQDITLDHVSIEAPKGLRLAYTQGIVLRQVDVVAAKGPPLLVEDTVGSLTR